MHCIILNKLYSLTDSKLDSFTPLLYTCPQITTELRTTTLLLLSSAEVAKLL